MSDIVTQEQLEQVCREWQQRLRLQDWRVRPIWRDWVSMSVLGRSGEVHWNLQHKSATIYIVPPGQRCDDSIDTTPGGWEQTLVHELVHLHFAPFDDSGGEHETAQEQAINAIAEALVTAVRCGTAVYKGMADTLGYWQERAEAAEAKLDAMATMVREGLNG